MTDVDFIISELRTAADPQYLVRMQHFGINASKALGLRVPQVRALARQIGKNQPLSLALWNTGIHEARLLAAFIGDYTLVTPEQIDAWVADFSSWDICDQASTLFIKTPWFADKVFLFAARDAEFEKRCAFSMIAEAAVHLKNEPDANFLKFFPLIAEHAADNRNFVKKAVNWALRQLGKRSAFLHAAAKCCAEEIVDRGDKHASRVAKHALVELNSQSVFKKLDLYS
ncbi:DNA alkylation repair protein [Pedobacter sp. SYP-B3415]|uniref:DNA alkylation repair protein n=1 Tax=Pedobacter sp. SYP-B3415 TaxID=2496641 RepID=UPI00101C4899|nr:DNA alkylation repair protein [Pedobacter sp. SYP-B3415]